MKKISFLLVILAFSIGFNSCDKIDEPYLEQSQVVACDTPSFPALSNPIQKVFLEEFTGHTCVNCPQGHKKAADLKDLYGDTLVLMSIHGGSTAEPVAGTIYTADYRTDAGNELYTSFSVSGNPAGLVNRTSFMGNLVLGVSYWSAAVKAIDRTNPKLAIQLETVDNESANSVCIFAKTTFLQATQKNIKLSLFLIEDSIVSPQKNNLSSIGPVPDITDYIHRHMLRASVNPVWGDVIANSSTSMQPNTSLIKGYTFSFVGKSFVKSKCSVIAVAYDADTKEVIQVEEIHLSH